MFVCLYESMCLCFCLLECVKKKERPREMSEFLLNGFRNVTFSLTNMFMGVDVLKELV